MDFDGNIKEGSACAELRQAALNGEFDDPSDEEMAKFEAELRKMEEDDDYSNFGAAALATPESEVPPPSTPWMLGFSCEISSTLPRGSPEAPDPRPAGLAEQQVAVLHRFMMSLCTVLYILRSPI